jgi:hypothetical protein
VEFDGIQLKEGLKPTLFDIKAVNFRAKCDCIIDLAHGCRGRPGVAGPPAGAPPRRRREKFL